MRQHHGFNQTFIRRSCTRWPPTHPHSGKEIHFIEFGVGGGITQEGTEPARTAAEAAYYPYFGIFGAYTYVVRELGYALFMKKLCLGLCR